jgi:C4-dicarboxylate-specific signal transduction histidine kinase
MSQRRSITQQVLIFALLTCAGVLVPVGGGLFLHYYHQTQVRLSESLATTARITAANVAAALAFGDKDSAAEILSTLRLDPRITSATVEDAQHRVFAQYPKPSSGLVQAARTSAAYQTEQAVVFDGVNYGHLHLTGDISKALHRAVATWSGVYALAFLLAGSTVFFIARRFQRQVASPIIALAATARRVAQDRDFTTRAPLTGCTEIDHLASALNLSFSEIALHQSHLDEEFEALQLEVRDRLAAEEALRQNQHAMNRLSREAGMAEVASGVIHNIGNTLTSISISSDLVATRLANARRRPLETLGRLLDPASPHTDALFTAHPEGPELRALLAKITQTLATDLEETGRLVGILQAGNSHLKRIVATQQSLARNRHLLETFMLRDALQEALLLARTLSRHHAPIDDCPANDTLVYADRSLVVHILLNLLINAHDAIGSHGPAKPRITLTIGEPQAGLLPITVTDNGEGICSERILSIFTYGFTTKAHGNGFGLHNSANAARMLGGDLFVTSPGPGCGASFTLRLPTHPPIPFDDET